jgi:pimeloyl-ACP methyl ester carboxylesterase
VCLVYGEQDWAPSKERERTSALIPGVTTATIAKAGHFLSLDRPDELNKLIIGFAGA